MNLLGICLLAQFSLTFGMAGLLWPDKFMQVFAILMFPWAASYRTVRVHSVAAIGLSLALFVKLISASL